MGRFAALSQEENISGWLKPSKPDETEMVAVDDITVSVMMEIEE